MLPDFQPVHLLYLALAIALEIGANVLMKQSHGFAFRRPAVAAIVCALAAFTALSFAVRGIQLSVAYGIWGGAGLVATAELRVGWMFCENGTLMVPFLFLVVCRVLGGCAKG